MRTFVFADIHGCFTELQKMLERLKIEAKLNYKKDRLIFLGDYVDRGLETAQLIDWCVSKSQEYPHWVFLYGNHEDLMVDSLLRKSAKYGNYYLWFNQGGQQTFYSYTQRFQDKLAEKLSEYEQKLIQPIDVIPSEHLFWLSSRPYYYEDENYFYVHAGVPHAMPLTNFTNKIKEDLKKGDIKSGSYPDTAIWIRDQFINSTYDWGKKIIFGHTCDYSGRYRVDKKSFYPIIMGNKIGLDCAVCPPSSKRFCALELPNEKIYINEVT